MTATEGDPAIPDAREKYAARARARLEGAHAIKQLGQRALSGIRSSDTRFGHLVDALSSKAESLDEIARNPNAIRGRLDPSEILSRIEDLKQAIESAKRQSLSAEIATVLNPDGKAGHEAVLYRLGLLNGRPTTLQEAADTVGVTRERIRQIQVKREAAILSRPYMPVYAAAQAALNHAVMSGARKVNDVEHDLRQQGFLKDSDCIGQIVRLAELRGDDGCQLDRRQGEEIVGFAKHLQRIEIAESIAAVVIEEETRNHGACSRPLLEGALAERGHSSEADADRLALVLGGIPGLRTIRLGDREWFHLGHAYTIALMARKILSVSPCIHVTELRRGIQRNYRVKAIPPSAALAQIVSLELPDWGITVDGDVMTANAPQSPDKVLPRIELTFYEVFTANGGVMARAELLPEMKTRGMNVTSFEIMLGNSPIIQSYGRGVHGLRGAAVTPGQIEALAAHSGSRTQREPERDYGHMADGRVWLKSRLREYDLDHRFIYEPTSVRKYIADGEYKVAIDATPTSYVASVSVGQIRLRGNLLEATGAEEGDYALMVFDRSTMAVDVLIGGENVVERAVMNEAAASEDADLS
ncbi:MAG: hypothetical protein ABSE64_04215 [Vulcanimicrobiaceae bacterium]|jgi:hypothetical protein